MRLNKTASSTGMFNILIFLMGSLLVQQSADAADPYYSWTAKNFSIQQPLGGLKGDANRGRKLVISRNKGNCLACHAMPIPEESFHGTIGPTLKGIGKRLSIGELRLRVVNQTLVNPATIMPAFYRNPKKVNRILDEFEGKTFLTAQEVEDVVAYLVTLK